jgi:hypothetical protein
MSPEFQRYLQTEAIKKNFDIESVNIGVALEGTYTNTDNETVTNPHFQYDTISRNLLMEAKDDARIPYWRSVDNQNILLTNEEKNTLYELLKFTYFTKFAESRQDIDLLI